jgi:hypothetical protein
MMMPILSLLPDVYAFFKFVHLLQLRTYTHDEMVNMVAMLYDSYNNSLRLFIVSLLLLPFGGVSFFLYFRERKRRILEESATSNSNRN